MAFGADNNDLTATVDAHMAFHRAFYELPEHKLLLDLWKSWEAPAADVLLRRSSGVCRLA